MHDADTTRLDASNTGGVSKNSTESSTEALTPCPEQPTRHAEPVRLSKTSHTRHPIVIELCAGSAMLSCQFREAGVEALAVDHQRNRFHPLAPICCLDLTKQHAWDFLLSMLDQYAVLFAHAAPPRGTLPDKSPQPLRSVDQPMGLANLSLQDQARVDAANAIYLHLSFFLQQCTNRGIAWSVANPSRSFLWEIPCIMELFSSASFVDFDACAWGCRTANACCLFVKPSGNESALSQLPRGA